MYFIDETNIFTWMDKMKSISENHRDHDLQVVKESIAIESNYNDSNVFPLPV